MAHMSLSDLAFLYRARLRARTILVQELLAVAGIAVGVALLFASQVASASLTRSFSGLVHEIVGGGHKLLLEARGPDGFDQRLLADVSALPGVRRALPLLEVPADVVGPRGREAVDLIGTDPRLAHAGGPLLRRYSARQLATQQAVALPQPIAQRIGVGSLEIFHLQIGATVNETLLATTLGSEDVGGLVHSPVAITNVSYAQAVAGLKGRLTRILVEPQAGREAVVAAGLQRVAPGAEADVEPADHDALLFEVASEPARRSEGLFAAIAALVAFMFALNAMLITVPARRRLIEDIRAQGATRLMALQVALCDAAILGAIGCALGLGLGDLLSLVAFRSPPGYLAFAFPVGDERIITLQSAVVAGGAGLIAALVGVLWPLRDALMDSFSDRRERGVGARAKGARLPLAGFGLLSITGAILALSPRYAVLGSVTLVAALLCLLPKAFDGMLGLLARVQGHLGSASTVLAVTELGTPRTRVRSLAIAATAGVAAFGIVELGGAQANLQHGLDETAHALDSSAAVWVAPSGEANTFLTTSFKMGAAELARLPGVAAVETSRSGFLNWGKRRLWVIAPPASAVQPLPASQLRRGSLTSAEERVRQGGWAVLSESLADEHGLRVGESFVLPSPRPTSLRVAAISSNLGWPTGAVVMNSEEYARAWGSGAPSAFQIGVQHGSSVETVRGEITRALGTQSGLAVETSAERERLHDASSREGLSRLTQIRALLLVAGVLGVAGAMVAMLWQRRELVASIRCEGYRRAVVWRWLCVESAVLIVVGAGLGCVFGLFGQVLATRFTATVTGFPVVYGAQIPIAIVSAGALSAVAVAVISLPGYLIARTPPRNVGAAY